ncbi:hypothetical protein AAZX31_05G065400 [Glycine max]
MQEASTPTEIDAKNPDLVAATKEMQRANYSTFVMLINMSPLDTIKGNVTFLMPNDRMLDNMVLQEGSVSNFLLRHSIPSPLLFDVLEQFPTGTTIPTCALPNCMLRVSNNGRKNYVLNNVKIISPNLYGILSEACTSIGNYGVPLLPCVNSTEPSCKASPPIPSSFPSASPPSTRDNLNPPTLAAPRPTTPNFGPHKSGSPRWFTYNGSLNFVACLMLYLVRIYF